MRIVMALYACFADVCKPSLPLLKHTVRALYVPLIQLSLLMVTSSFDKLFEKLRDEKWHGIGEIRTAVALSPDQLDATVSLLQDMEFVHKKDEKLKITQRGLKYLRL